MRHNQLSKRGRSETVRDNSICDIATKQGDQHSKLNACTTNEQTPTENAEAGDIRGRVCLCRKGTSNKTYASDKRPCALKEKRQKGMAHTKERKSRESREPTTHKPSKRISATHTHKCGIRKQPSLLYLCMRRAAVLLRRAIDFWARLKARRASGNERRRKHTKRETLGRRHAQSRPTSNPQMLQGKAIKQIE